MNKEGQNETDGSMDWSMLHVFVVEWLRNITLPSFYWASVNNSGKTISTLQQLHHIRLTQACKCVYQSNQYDQPDWPLNYISMYQ